LVAKQTIVARTANPQTTKIVSNAMERAVAEPFVFGLQMTNMQVSEVAEIVWSFGDGERRKVSINPPFPAILPTVTWSYQRP
jgi:hypothetical protein